MVSSLCLVPGTGVLPSRARVVQSSIVMPRVGKKKRLNKGKSIDSKDFDPGPLRTT